MNIRAVKDGKEKPFPSYATKCHTCIADSNNPITKLILNRDQTKNKPQTSELLKSPFQSMLHKRKKKERETHKP